MYNSLGLFFFLAQVQHGGGGWSANVFFALCKKCDRKKQQQGGLCGSLQKDRASHEVRMVGIFAGWGLVLRSCL